MEFEQKKNKIEIFGKEDFCASHIFECGQIFAYEKFEDETRFSGKNLSNSEKIHVFDCFSGDKKAEIFETRDGYEILTNDSEFFVNFFGLKTDYSKIKEELSSHKIMKEPIEYGSGIRILKQNLFEILISFIVSANNNIKRIQLILGRMREKFGKNMGEFFAFPTRKSLLQASVKDFSDLGAGYRAEYLFKVIRQIDENTLETWKTLPTATLRNNLISLSGVGPKVADCVLLFGYGRGDVFPVDTWVEKVFHHFYDSNEEDKSSFVEENMLDNENLKEKNFEKLEEKNFEKLEEKNCEKNEKITKNEEKNSKNTQKNCINCKKGLTREKIREILTDEFGSLSGYAQQYLFFYMRSFQKKV